MLASSYDPGIPIFIPVLKTYPFPTGESPLAPYRLPRTILFSSSVATGMSHAIKAIHEIRCLYRHDVRAELPGSSLIE